MSQSSSNMPDSLVDLARMFPYFVRSFSDFDIDYELGKNDYETVSHAKDKKTGKEVAVNILSNEKYGQRFELKYIQEVYALAICRNRFIVKLIGFTVVEPFCIITEFNTKGTLNKMITGTQAKKNPPTWAQLTFIALGLSHGLAHIHSHGLVHMDIMASNVLMSDKGVPAINDFAAAHFADKMPNVLKRNGSVKYMAPELFSKGKIGQPVDVFAFGMLLYEMSELHIAYPHMTRDEIREIALTRDVLPEFSKKTPPPLQKLIEKCWGPSDRRPTMQEIFDAFATGAVSFKNPEKRKLSKIVQDIKNLQSEVEKQSQINPPCYVDIDKEIQKLQIQQTYTVDKNTPRRVSYQELSIPNDRIDWDILSHYTTETFAMHLRGVASKFKTKDLLNKLYQTTAGVFASGSEQIIIQALECYKLVMLNNNDFIDICYQEMLIPSLPSSTAGLKKASLDILAVLFHFRPSLVDQQIEKLLLDYIKEFPAELIIISSHYVKQISDARAVIVLDALLKSGELYFNIDAGAHYLTLFYTVLQENDIYSSGRAQIIRSMVVSFTQSPNTNVAACAYRILAHLHPQNDLVFSAVLEQLGHEEILEPLLSCLLRAQGFPNSRRLCAKLIEIAKKSPKASAILLLFASQNSISHTVAADVSWYTSPLPTVSDTFKLLLLLYSYSDSKQALRTNPQFPNCLKFLVMNCDSKVLTYLPPLLRRSYMDAAFVNQLNDNGFLDNFFQRSAESQDVTIMHNSITLVVTIASICFVSSLIPEIGRLKDFMSNNQLIGSAITAISTLSQLKECRPHLVAFTQYFTSLLNYRDYAQVAQAFLNNINQN